MNSPVSPSTPTAARSSRTWKVIAALVLVVCGGAWVYRYGVRDHLFPKNFGVVDAGKVYRSGKLTPSTLSDVVEEHGIRTIVDLGAWAAGSPEDVREQRTAEALGVERYRFELVGDGTGNPNHYVNTLRLMTDPAKQPVLVHCGAGSERTGISVMLYRNITLGTPLPEAYEEARRYRHDPERNPMLPKVLERFAGPILEAYRAGGPIDDPEVPPVPAPEPVPALTPTR